MKTKLWSLMLTMFASAMVYAAGDIYEIRPCDEFGLNRGAYATLANPITSAGTTSFYFNVRLQIRESGGQDPNKGRALDNLKRYYHLAHKGFGDPSYDALYTPLSIGVFVSGKVTSSDEIVDSGQLDYAKLVSIQANTNSLCNFFDCIFEYELKPGHFALPVRLAVEDKDSYGKVTRIRPADDSLDSSSYHFINTQYWEIRYVDTVTPVAEDKAPAVWSITFENTPHRKPNGETSYTQVADYSLKQAGLYVQTVDFDQDVWEAPGEYWREVPMGDEINCPVKAFAEASGVEKDTTLYVWSMDESAVKIVGGETVSVVTNIISGVKYSTDVQVGTIKIKGGSATGDFDVYGVMSNKTADIVLSAWKGYRYSTYNNERIVEYKTIPVKCGAPPVPSVQLSFDKDKPAAPSGKKLAKPADPSTNYVDRATEKIPLYVTLTKDAAQDVKVNIKVKYEANAAVDPIKEKFLAISDNGDEFSASSVYVTNVTFTVAEMGRGELQKTLYIYPLGGNADTKSQGIGLYPELPDPAVDAKYEKGERALLQISSSHAPVIMLPKDGADYGTVSGAAADGFDVSLMINDCYRDLMNTNGFTVSFGSALKGQSATNIVFTAGEPIDLHLTGYDKKKDGEQTGTIKITEPAEPGMTPKSATVQITFKVAVEEEKKIALTEWYDVVGTEQTLHVGTSFNEGGDILPKFEVTGGTPSEDLYVFLIPQNAVSSNRVDSKIFTQGIPLYATKSETEKNDFFKLSLLDGCAETDGSAGQLVYKLVVSKSQTDPTKVDGTFTPTPATISLSVKNVYSETTKMFIASNPTPIYNGQHFKTPISCNVTNDFVAAVSDVSMYDVTNGLYVVWNFSDGYDFAPQYNFTYTCVSNTSVGCQHAFETQDTTQQVQCVALDKDMLAKLGGASKLTNLATLWPRILEMVGEKNVFKVSVYISNAPYIRLVNENDQTSFSIDENITAMSSKTVNLLKLSLSEPAKNDLKVKITYKTYSDYTNPKDIGILEFNTTNLTFKKGATIPSGEFKELKYSFGKLDGAKGSMDGGFYVKAEVITPGLTDYYLPGEAEIFVVNQPPVISPAQPETVTTNYVSAGEAFTIEGWSLSDVATDMSYGLEARWYIDNAEQKAKRVTGITTTTETNTTLTLSSPGAHEIKLRAFDKDGENYNGVSERTWIYYVNPVKSLMVRPVGPVGQSDSKYGAAPGLGLGRVYANGTSSLVESFFHTYYYSVEDNEAQVYAFGYPHKYDANGNPVPYADDGTLGGEGKDIALDKDGNTYVAPAQRYMYDGRFDNFFYRWVIVGGGNTGTTNCLGKVFFDLTPGAKHQELVTLDKFVAGKNSYLTTVREAIFSRELYESDNLGDINGDGVPDAYLQIYTDLGVVNVDGAVVGDDIKSIADNNMDGDFTPSANNAIFPGLSNTWMTAANIFTVADEIRGYDYHLNHALPGTGYGYPKGIAKLVNIPDIKYVMPLYDTDTGVVTNGSTLSELEYGAFVKWCENHDPVLDPADPENWKKWTPECPTDPTLSDTDNDGIPDGYEYYFWYRAHVGDPVQSKGTNVVKMTGRRYVVAKPGEPEIITPAEIEALFNPNQRNLLLDGIDTDNDGIPDAHEYALGTNPFDFDTDRDGLPDGFEILCSKTDPLKYATNGSTCDADLNLDKDAMAYLITESKENSEEKVYVIPAFEIVKAVTNEFLMCSFKEFTFDAETGKLTGNPNDVRFYTTWVYGVDGMLARGRDLGIGSEISNVVVDVTKAVSTTNLLEVHYQVYHHKCFDPRTAWNVTLPPPEPSVDTRHFTAGDEHLVLGFLINEGLLTPDEYTPTKELPLTTIWQKYTTACAEPADADTDADGIPDGWELYTMAGPLTYGPKKGNVTLHFVMRTWTARDVHSPFIPEFSIPESAKHPDVPNSLNFQEEYSGVSSVKAYADCASVILCAPEWRNKAWPTDPWNADTDGDGLTDGEEGKAFIYGTSGVAGGGLNPLSWDTDGDYLPDPWELEFAGTVSNGTDTVSTTVAADGTTNVTTTAGAVAWNNDGMDGTVNDAKKDYDHDGLLNWQEYMVGAMRHFRYDDSVSQWGTTSMMKELDDLDPNDEEAWGRFWYLTLIDPVNNETEDAFYSSSHYYNRFTMLDQGTFDAGMAYFSQCTNEWDSAKNKLYMFKDGIYHDLKNPPSNMYFIGSGADKIQLNRYFWKLWVSGDLILSEMCFEDANMTRVTYPKKYICCDPTMPDTDGDGMDDYYELFHGLNPLLGASGVSSTFTKDETGLKSCMARDVVWQAYEFPMAPTAELNWWSRGLAPLENDTVARVKIVSGEKRGHDFVNYPWLAGLADADPDGDDVRNYEEAIMANVQAASTYLHTDPSPLWMTDLSYANSLTVRYYYPIPIPANEITCPRGDFTFTNPYTGEEETHKFDEFPSLKWDKKLGIITVSYPNYNNWNLLMGSAEFDFEQNEGYDSDHDFLSDNEERRGKTKSASDPQDHDDPLRRQAMWFGGEDDPGFLETPLTVDEMPSQKEGLREPCETFEFFTAEFWAKPDAATYNKSGTQVVLERSVYTGKSSANDSQYVRKNFIIGIRDGHWFAGFDFPGTSLDRFELTGPKSTTNWTHVALVYDGVQLTLYVRDASDISNVSKVYDDVGRHPEHGLYATLIDSAGNFIGVDTPKYSSNPVLQPLAVFMVGGSVKTVYGHKFDFKDPMVHWTNISDYGDFYRGYVDEVRVWDGARTETQINTDFAKRYTVQDAEDNRQLVYKDWVNGANRIDNNINGTLPAQLMYHWTFDHLPGAVKVGDVLKSPAGFSTAEEITDAKAIWSRPSDWVNPWRANIFHPSLKSTVYTDEAWVPWINDTVSHLPRFDGSTDDSMYWTEGTVGFATAASLGYKKFGFNRTHEVYSLWNQLAYDDLNTVTTPSRWENLQQLGGNIDKRVSFTFRNRHTYGDDMLPFGSAFPKRISSADGGMWDEQGAADAWAQTASDTNNDGLPDWWTAYALENYYEGEPTGTVTWNTIVNYYGAQMTAMEAYKRDLAKGMLSDLEYHEEYADIRDLDRDGMPDWWEDMYGVDTGSTADRLADPDHDGLSNYQEYLAAEKYGWYVLDPKLAKTYDGQRETDYFLRLNAEQAAKLPRAVEGMYLGEALADHDFIEDGDEKAIGTDPTIYDAYSDKDEDGWTAFSEARYSAFKQGISARFVSHMNGEEEVTDAPVPVVHLTARYNGEDAGTNAIVVEAYSGNNLQKRPTATYRFTPGSAQTRYLNLGTYEDRVIHGTLAPGHILAGEDQIKLQFFFIQSDDKFSWTITANGEVMPYTGTYAEMVDAMATYGTDFSLASQSLGWNDLVVGSLMKYTDGAQQVLQIDANENTQKGHLLLAGQRAGEIDLITGDFDIDLSSVGSIYVEGSLVQLSQCFFRIEYQSVIPQQQNKALSLSLAKPDTGKLTEGATAFVAYMDKDGDGAFTPGFDPIGFAKDVQVGWDNVPELVIEMTDSSQAAGKRFAIPDAAEAIRVIRTTINGQDIVNKSAVKRRIVYSRTAADVARKNVYEADLVTGSKFGLDWTSLRNDILNMEGVTLKDVTEVGYIVVTNIGSVQNISAADILDSFSVVYTAEAAKPVCVSPTVKSYGIVETQRPTFKWTAPDGFTCFRLEIGDTSGTDWFYDSGLQILPARNASSQFVWTAPVFIGTNVCNDVRILANNSNYTWRVAMYNAKFSSTNEADTVWSDNGAFTTALAEVNDGSTTYGSASVNVKYFGPATNDLADVIVDLYKNADFTGMPAARTRLFDVEGDVGTLTNGSTVVFHGLEDGDYYAVAFIDRNGNGQRDNWETWGYSAQVGKNLSAIWNVSSLTSDATSTKIPLIDLYLEDTDINQNDILDIFDDESILKSAAETSSTGADLTDDDMDGLTADEETSDTYTDKAKWDTDGDGMPDGWEARFADTDPLMMDAILVGAGDVMAYAEVQRIRVTDADGHVYLLNPRNKMVEVGAQLDYSELVSTYDYVTVTGSTNLTTKTLNGVGTNMLSRATKYQVQKVEDVTAVLVHAQVYDEFGFNQLTALPGDDAINTKSFTALDKYMLVRYFQAIGIRNANEEIVNTKGLWKDYTLKPGEKDCDFDGMADGWELYVMFGTNTVTAASHYATPSETPINPWRYADARDMAFDYDGDGLSLLGEFNRGNAPMNPWNAHSFNDEINDKDAYDFNIASGATQLADDDNDGLSNWAEYLAWKKTGAAFDVKESCSVSSNVLDYFVKTADGKYVGESLDADGKSLIADHDFMEDTWEDLWDPSDVFPYSLYANRYVYDANLDADEDGWKNWSECRAYHWGCGFYADIIDTFINGDIDSQLRCMPQPAIGLHVTYNGKLDPSWKSLIVRTRTKDSNYPDAIFQVDSMRKASGGGTVSVGTNTTATVGGMEKTQILGVYNGMRIIRGLLNPGLVVPSSAKFEYTPVSQELTYYWHCTECPRGSGTYADYKADITEHGEAKTDPNNKGVTLDETKPSQGWTTFVTSGGGSDGRHGEIFAVAGGDYENKSGKPVGTIDYRTGEFSINLERLVTDFGMNFDGVAFRAVFTYNLGAYWPQTVWLSAPEKGYVKEGDNTIEAFFDLNSDGKYDVGEPYGILRHVNIGWNKTPEMRIELKDGTYNGVPVFEIESSADEYDSEQSSIGTTQVSDGSVKTARLKVDGAKIDGAKTNDNEVLEFSLAPDGDCRGVLQIVRTAINGNPLAVNRTVFSKKIDVTYGKVFTIADFIRKGQVDLDSRYLIADAADAGIFADAVRTATYSVYWGEDGVDPLFSFTRTFATTQVAPTLGKNYEDSYYKLLTTQPEFTWTGNDGYVAFAIQVSEKEDFSTVLYATTNLMSAAGAYGYSFRPPLYVGQELKDQTTYYWRVAQLNAKFTENKWSKVGAFSTAVDSSNANTGYGKLAAEVRYYGPAETAVSNVIVGVYEAGDFCCAPVARMRLSGDKPVCALTNESDRIFTKIATNVVFDGIAPGEYYVMAFVDVNGNGVRDAYETWGYVCKIATEEKDLWTPVATTVVSTKQAVPQVLIVMEDTDVNQNMKPDCLEDMSAWMIGDDSDADGLSDADEDEYGTDSGDWDSDGDGMPDGWEALFAGLDPNEADAEAHVSGDVMAYAEVERTFVTVWDGQDATTKTLYVLPKDAKTPTVGDDTTNLTLYATYHYGDVEGLGLEAGVVTGKVWAVESGTLALVHAQVYSEYGFDSATAVPYGQTVNTKEFTALDKYLVLRYFEAIGLTNEVQNAETWENWTLKPGVVDFDNDGIADGWELYTMFGPKVDTTAGVTAADMLMSPWDDTDRNEDADRDGLANVYEYDNGYRPTDPSDVDTDNDGITDYYAQMYHLKGDDAGKDNDGDGLSNYAEYLISEVFQYAKLDPDDPKTDGSCIDYFRKMGELYFGEIFTDHDQVDDQWEQGFADMAGDGAVFANRYVYDPMRDADGDGWSNYAEAKAGTNPELVNSVGVDGYTYAEHPVPMIEARVTYNGKLNGIIAPVVFQAWNEKADPDMTQNPDAIWTVKTVSDSATATKREKYLGKNPGETCVFTLGPGAIAPGTVRIYFRDQGWKYAVVKDDKEEAEYNGDSSEAKWFSLVQDIDGILYTSVTNETVSVAVGTVDYTTGRLSLNLGSPALNRSIYAQMVNASSNNSATETDKTRINKYYNRVKIDLANSYVKIAWNSSFIGTTVGGAYYLGDADAAAADDSTDKTSAGTITTTAMSRGYVREGKTKFVVFADLDSDGSYTPGEPFGFVYGVDVGWQGAKFSVDLTDTHPVFARMDLTDGTCDRQLWSSMSTTIKTNKSNVVSIPSGNVRVRVIRTAINGVPMDKISHPDDSYKCAPQRVVMDKVINTSVRKYIHEGDFIDANTPDIDWKTLSSDSEEYQSWGWPDNVTCVTYRIVFGDEAISKSSVSNAQTFVYAVDRRFDTDYNTVKTVITPYDSVVTYNTRPTFKWAITDGTWNYNSYAAFKVEIKAVVGRSNVTLYDSGLRPMPGFESVNGINYYVWTAPSVVDNLFTQNGKIERNGNYKWQVTVYNSKFRGGKQSAFGDLTTAVNVVQNANDHEYSAIPVTVKYAGPIAVLSKATNLSSLLGKVRVQAFTSADFSGEPVSEAIITRDLADTSHTITNGVVYGLPRTGAYYLRAYIDSNGNLKKDEWESWGAAKSVVTPGDVTPVGIWIEDADTDDDWLPDAWEFVKAGWDDSGSWLKKKGKDVSGEFVVTKSLYDSVADKTLSAGVSTGMSGAALTVFTYDEVAGLVCGGTDYHFSSVDDIRQAVQKKVRADTLKITSITLDPEGKKVVIGVGAEVADTIAGRLITKIYDFNTTATLKIDIYSRETLAENWGETPVCTKTVTVDKNLDTLVDVPVEDIDMSSGFFKVEINQLTTP